MQLPFTADEFFGVFREYNETLWPAQLFLLTLALVAIVLLLVPRRWSGAGVSAILAFLWLWLAVAYHLGPLPRKLYEIGGSVQSGLLLRRDRDAQPLEPGRYVDLTRQA
jgi:hypothetical protein